MRTNVAVCQEVTFAVEEVEIEPRTSCVVPVSCETRTRHISMRGRETDAKVHPEIQWCRLLIYLHLQTALDTVLERIQSGSYPSNHPCIHVRFPPGGKPAYINMTHKIFHKVLKIWHHDKIDNANILLQEFNIYVALSDLSTMNWGRNSESYYFCCRVFLPWHIEPQIF